MKIRTSSASICVTTLFLLVLTLSHCCIARGQTLKDRINTLASQPGNYGADLQAKVLARATGIAPQNRPYIFNGVQDCWGYVRQVWNAILSDGTVHSEDYYPNNYDRNRWLGLTGGLLTGDAPNPDWVYYSDRSVLLPGDMLSTDQGHAWGLDWHGGIFAGKDANGSYRDWDCTPYNWSTNKNDGHGADNNPLNSGYFSYYYKPIHDLLAKPVTLSTTDIYVSLNGNDSSNGSASTPFRTVRHAVDIANATQPVTIHITSGAYGEKINTSKHIHFVTSGSGTVRIGG